MPSKVKDLIYTTLFGAVAVPPQHEKADGSYVETGEKNPLPTVLTGSNVTDFKTAAVTITATAVELKTGQLTGRKQLIIYPPDTGTIYWGASGVTSANGAPLAAGNDPVEFEVSETVKVYAASDGTDRTIRVVESK